MAILVQIPLERRRFTRMANWHNLSDATQRNLLPKQVWIVVTLFRLILRQSVFCLVLNLTVKTEPRADVIKSIRNEIFVFNWPQSEFCLVWYQSEKLIYNRNFGLLKKIYKLISPCVFLLNILFYIWFCSIYII